MILGHPVWATLKFCLPREFWVALRFFSVLSPVTSRSHCTLCDLSAIMAWDNTSKFIAERNSPKCTEPYRQTTDTLLLPVVILLHFVLIFPVNLLHNWYISILVLLVHIDNPLFAKLKE